jgi:hypothetical protein
MARILGFRFKPEFRISLFNYKEAVLVENLANWFKTHTVIFTESIFNIFAKQLTSDYLLEYF